MSWIASVTSAPSVIAGCSDGMALAFSVAAILRSPVRSYAVYSRFRVHIHSPETFYCEWPGYAEAERG
jgi:surfactin synthase thioesterase subunit